MKKGDQVRWKWGSSHAEGKIVEVHHDEIEKEIKGKSIKRKGSKEDPALVIEQEDKDLVLKLASEVEKA